MTPARRLGNPTRCRGTARLPQYRAAVAVDIANAGEPPRRTIPPRRQAVAAAARRTGAVVAADGGVDSYDALSGLPPLRAVIGDMDSIQDPGAWRHGPARFVHLAEQNSTDFEKCLYATEAPLYIGAGFTGGRVDHSLAALHAILRHDDKRVVLIGTGEVMALAPPERVLRVAVTPGSTVSIYPLLAVRGTRSRGLAWPVEGLEFAPGLQSGTSNQATDQTVEVAFDGPGALVILERRALASLARAIAGD